MDARERNFEKLVSIEGLKVLKKHACCCSSHDWLESLFLNKSFLFLVCLLFVVFSHHFILFPSFSFFLLLLLLLYISYKGNSWDPSLCPDGKTCAANCAIEAGGIDTYTNTYGVTATGDSLSIGFVTHGQ